MKIATTTEDFRFLENNEEAIKRISDAGFRYIDLSIYTQPQTLVFMGDDWKEYVLRLKEHAKKLGVKYVQAHSPGFNAFEEDDMLKTYIEQTIRSIEVCGMLGIPTTVVHSGCDFNMEKDEFFEKNLKFYKLLYPAMEENNVNVLIENNARANLGERYAFYDGKTMKEFLEYANHSLLHACWDTGHANLEGHQYEDIIDLGEELYAIHFNDNRGEKDEHIIPYMGNFAIDDVMIALKEINYKGYFTFEANNSIWGGEMRSQICKNNILAEPPVFLFDEIENIKYKIGKYILEKYDCFEE